MPQQEKPLKLKQAAPSNNNEQSDIHLSINQKSSLDKQTEAILGSSPYSLLVS